MKHHANRIVYVDESSCIGGAEEYLKILLNGFSSRLEVYLLHPEDQFHCEFYEETNVTKIATPITACCSSAGLIMYYSRVLREIHPEVLHVNLPAPNYCRSAIIAAFLCGIPNIIATNHLPNLTFPRSLLGALAGRSVWDWLIWRIVFKLIGVTITVSKSSAASLAANYPAKPDRIACIYNGVDPLKFGSRNASRALEIRKEFGVHDEELLITSIGRMHPQKGYVYLLKAIQIIASVHHNFTLLLVGDGPLLADLSRIADDLGVKNKVKFAGERKDIPEILAASDVYVNSSLFEGLPFSVLEAMASGVIVIATSVDGNAEVLSKAGAGVLVRAQDPDGLADALIYVLGNEEQRAVLGRRGHEVVLQEFTIAKMLESTERLYAERVPGLLFK